MLPLVRIAGEVLRQCFGSIQHGMLFEPLDIRGIGGSVIGKYG